MVAAAGGTDKALVIYGKVGHRFGEDRMRPVLRQAVAAVTSHRKLRCSFCRRDAASVARLVAGASGYICDACITACVEVLRNNGGFEPPGQTRPHQLPTR